MDRNNRNHDSRNLIFDTFYPQGGSRPARTRKERRGSVRSRTSSPTWRAYSPTIAWSKVAHTDIYDDFGASGKRFFVQSCCPECICGPVLAYRCDSMKRRGWPRYLPGRNLIFRTSYRQEGSRPSRTSKERSGAAFSRISSPI